MTNEVTPEVTKCMAPLEARGRRVDQIAVELFPEYSRARLQTWLKNGDLLVNGKKVKPSGKLLGGEAFILTAIAEPVSEVHAEAIEIDVIYADEAVIVINKPAGLVVHPGAGNWSGTLQNALLHYDPELAGIPRAGIVHRLDKETTGIMMVARSLQAHKKLVDALQARIVSREYLALAVGEMVAGGSVDQPIGRHAKDRKRMAVTETGKEAITHYRINRRYQGFTLLDVKLETGRTHQIRVHMAYIQHPLVGDTIYGGRRRIPAGLSEETRTAVQQFSRQALHARRLSFEHPVSGEEVSFEAPLPADLISLFKLLPDK